MAFQALVRFNHINYVRRALRRERIFRERDNPFDMYDDIEFRKRFRLSKPTVHVLLNMISNQLSRRTNRSHALSPSTQLFIALRYYATGTFQLAVGDLYSTSQPSVSKAIKLVSKTLANLKPNYINIPHDTRRLKEDFFEVDQFPNIIGAIDGTHIKICNPGGTDPARFINRKNFFSINTQVICDAKGRILNIVARWPGSAHDSRIFNESTIKTSFENNLISGCLVGDQGYACLPYLMTPIANPLTQAEKKYNRSHIKTRNIIERMFGIWKRRFPVLRIGINTKLETAFIIIIALAVLQVIASEQNEPDPEDNDDDDDEDNDNDNTDMNTYVNQTGLQVRRNLILNHFSRIV